MGQASTWAVGVVALIFLQCVSSYKLVCYFTSWSQYRQDQGSFVPDAIDPNLCTHLIYAFANVEDDKIVATEWNDATTYEHLNNLKNRNHNLKTLLSLGGENFASERFRSIAGSPLRRSKFVMSVVSFLQNNTFDGFDLAWHTLNQIDKRNMAKLVQDLSVQFRHEASAKKKLILSVSVPAGRERIDRGYDIPALSQYADFLNFMTFDFHGSWEKHTGHPSPLYKGKSDTGAASFYNVNSAVKLLKSKGAPAEKIIMGIPTYGRTFTLSSSQTFVGATASGGGTPGHFTNSTGMLAYYEICDFNSRAHVERIEEQAVPYSYKGNQWVGYEDVTSVKKKVQYMKDLHLGGIMIWTLDLDDFSGSLCDQRKYPLVGAVKEELDKK
ncbi:chitinase-3-like protein 1 [Tiliqua scincoides]|uniref:chitinase-3-like protein 1 n=1 Tax=Tiliqua scincoides TaxID=71010 RepID=UPI0034626C97